MGRFEVDKAILTIAQTVRIAVRNINDKINQDESIQ
jgi:hypothetical protein